RGSIFSTAADAVVDAEAEDSPVALANSLSVSPAPAGLIQQAVCLSGIICNRFGKIAAPHLSFNERRVKDGSVCREIQNLKQFAPIDRHRQSPPNIAILE